MCTFALANRERCAKVKNKYRGVEQLVARQAHNLEVACSSRVSATILKRCKALFLTPLFFESDLFLIQKYVIQAKPSSIVLSLLCVLVVLLALLLYVMCSGVILMCGMVEA